MVLPESEGGEGEGEGDAHECIVERKDIGSCARRVYIADVLDKYRIAVVRDPSISIAMIINSYPTDMVFATTTSCEVAGREIYLSSIEFARGHPAMSVLLVMKACDEVWVGAAARPGNLRVVIMSPPPIMID